MRKRKNSKYIITLIIAAALILSSSVVVSMALTWEDNTICTTSSDCSGLAPSGSCEAQGFIVIDQGTCAGYYDQNQMYIDPSGCYWEYVASCDPACYLRCAQWSGQEFWNTDCTGVPTLVSYNQCACVCGSSGGGFESAHGEDCMDCELVY